MNANEPDEPKLTAADPLEAGKASTGDVPAKPRRRRTPKAAAADAVDTVDVAPEAAVPAEPPAQAAAPAKPARAPRRKRVADAGAEPVAEAQAVAVVAPTPAPEAPAAGDAGIEPAEGAARKPRAPRRPRVARESATADTPATAAEVEVSPEAAAPARQPTPPAGADSPGVAEQAGADADGAPPAGDASAASEPPREGNRRSRNRRRKRGERGERGEGGASVRPQAGSVDAEAVVGADVSVLLEPTDPQQLFAELLSGAFDLEPPSDAAVTPAEPPKRVLAPEPDAPKLHKVLAQSGIGSRRDMEQWVLEGRVTVNGEAAHTGQRISFGDRIAIDGKPIKVRIAPPPPRVLAYHKPAGEVVTHDDPQHRPTVFRRLPRLQHGKWQSVGRLDINTEGLLLFTNSGELANQLMHPRFGVEREYAVRSLGVLAPEQRDRLLEGVEIEGQRCAFKSIEDGGGEGVNHWYRVVITEGRNREVRRLFEAVGHAVSRLIRIRYGCVVLPRGLKRGVWVDLPEPDVRALRRLTGTERVRDGESDAGPRGKRGRRGGKNRDARPRDGSPDRGADRGPRPDRGARLEGEGPLNIPNPLQQTYDKRAIQQARSTRRELGEDDPIPNPLQQTYDRRALQRDRTPMRDLPEDGPIPNPLQQTYDKRFVQKTGFGGGGGRGGRPGRGGGGSAPRQPDPMQTAVGYIGADAFRGKGGKGGGRGGNRGGPGGNKGGGGGRGGGRHR